MAKLRGDPFTAASVIEVCSVKILKRFSCDYSLLSFNPCDTRFYLSIFLKNKGTRNQKRTKAFNFPSDTWFYISSRLVG